LKLSKAKSLYAFDGADGADGADGIALSTGNPVEQPTYLFLLRCREWESVAQAWAKTISAFHWKRS
jgi:hypothetical protein